jgi:hypothetical protein
VDGSTLSLLATDMTGNACIFAYDPKSSESWKGQKLLTKSAFHVGSPVHRMVRFRLKVGLGLLACSLSIPHSIQSRTLLHMHTSNPSPGTYSTSDKHGNPEFPSFLWEVIPELPLKCGSLC